MVNMNVDFKVLLFTKSSLLVCISTAYHFTDCSGDVGVRKLSLFCIVLSHV